jgi:proline iminopeptidase
MVMHGGPGSGSHNLLHAVFRSAAVPHYSLRSTRVRQEHAQRERNPATALTDNTIRHLIDDASALRQELGVGGKMHVFGDSGGSTLPWLTPSRTRDGADPDPARRVFMPPRGR